MFEYGEGLTYIYDDYCPVGCDAVFTKLHNHKDSNLRSHRRKNHEICKVNLEVNGQIPHPSRFTPGKDPRYSIEVKPGGLQSWSGLWRRRNFLTPSGNRTTIPRSSRPVGQWYRLFKARTDLSAFSVHFALGLLDFWTSPKCSAPKTIWSSWKWNCVPSSDD